MDNKKLMQILLRDVTELQELVLGIKNSRSFDPLDLELLYTRISGVRHMLEVVSDTAPSLKSTDRATLEVLSEKPVEPEITNLKDSIVEKVEQIKFPEPQPLDAEISKSPGTTVKEVSREAIHEKEKTEEPEEPKIVTTIEPEKPVFEKQSAPDNDEVQLEEEVAAPPQTFGEKFQHGKSVNDLLFEHGKTDYKYSNLPVSSLQSAIGINDRFLFIRELFEGKADNFTETIRKIDSMTSLHDAAVYLRENFKWKKNETSLKFIDLVKRRFL